MFDDDDDDDDDDDASCVVCRHCGSGQSPGICRMYLYIYICVCVCARWGGPESCPTHADVMRGPHSWRKRSGGSYVSCDGSWQLGIIHQVKPTCDPNRVVTLTVVITCAEDNAMVERHIQTAIAVTIINMRPGS